MGAHTFMLILDGPIDEATSDLLYEAGLDDAAITAFDGHPALDIDRDADSSGFPDPAYDTTTRSPLWRWTDVQAWLEPDAGTGVRRFRTSQTSQRKQRVDFCLDDFRGLCGSPGWKQS